MRFLAKFLCLLIIPLSASTAKQMLSICYFDQDQIELPLPELPNFIRETNEEGVEKGYMVFYERKITDVLSMFSFYGGVNFGKYNKNQDTLYSASFSLSSRFWVMHLLLFHPYIEASLFGPTILSKSEFALQDLKSNFLFQNYLSVGAEVGSGSGLLVELKAVRYFRATLTRPEPVGVHVPLLFSVGYLF